MSSRALAAECLRADMQGQSEVAGKANVLIFPGTLSHCVTSVTSDGHNLLRSRV